MNSPKKIATVSAAKPPAIAAPVPRWKTLDRLAADADELAASDIWEIERNVRPSASLATLDKAAAWLRDFDAGRDVARCRAALAKLDPEDLYDDSGELLHDVIVDRLTIFVGSFPGGAPNGNPEAYCAVLLGHVSALDGLRFVALDDACRVVAERPNAFAAGPGQLIEVIREKQRRWDRRLLVIDTIEGAADRLAAEIERLRPQVEAREAAQRVKAAQAELDAVRRAVSEAEQQIIARQAAVAKAAHELEAACALLRQWQAMVAEKESALAALTSAAALIEPPKDDQQQGGPR